MYIFSELYIMLWKSSHVHQSMTGTDHHYHQSALTLLDTHRHCLDPKLLLHTQLQLNSVLGAPRGQSIDDSFCVLSKKQECH